MFAAARLLSAALAVDVLAASLPSASASPVLGEDAALGMLLLGAYGDALGASTEERGLSGNFTPVDGVPQPAALSPFTGTSWDDTPWGTWPPLDDIVGRVGVVTDDTSVRVAVIEPWLKDALRKGGAARLDESSVVAYMDAREAALFANSPRSDVLEKERGMLADFLCMFSVAGVVPASACRHGGVNKFFFRGSPAVFGTYTYLELAALLAGRAAGATVFQAFSGLSALDQEWGRPYAGLMAALVAEAATGLPAAAPRSNFTGWYLGAARRVLADAEAAGARYATNLTAALYSAEAAAVRWRGENLTGNAVLQRYRDQVWDRLPPSPLKSQDPLTFLWEATFFWSYCAGEESGDGVRCAMSLSSRSAGDTDTVSSQMGVLLGAFHGYDKLARDPVVGPALRDVSQYLARWYNGYNATAAAQALVRSAPLLELGA